MKPLHSIIIQAFRMPSKSILTFLAVGLGTGILILAVSISDSFQSGIDQSLTGDGLIINISNAHFSAEGGLDPVRPAEFDQDIVEVLNTSISGIQAVSPVTTASWRTVTAGTSQYQIRRVTGAGPSYLDVMDLQLAAGLNFSESDVQSGETKAVISRSTAEALFGSAEEAIGKILQPPARTAVSRGGGGSSERTVISQLFTVSGVFEDANEVRRRSYGIADVVIPYTTGIQGGSSSNSASQMLSLWSTATIRVTGQTFSSVEAQIRDILSLHYGENTAVHVWEGQPNGSSSMLEETRNSISTFSLVINILGFVLLLTGSIGILSIMIVEVLGRNKDIAMERALGASKRSIVGEFFIRSLFMSLLSAAGGLILSFIFADPISNLLWPIISSMGTEHTVETVLTLRAAAIGIGTALVVGGIFGSIPVFSSFRAPIADSIREG